MRRKNQQSAESVNAVQVHPLSDAMHSELLINTSGIVILFDFVAYSPSLKYPKKKKPKVKKNPLQWRKAESLTGRVPGN